MMPIISSKRVNQHFTHCYVCGFGTLKHLTFSSLILKWRGVAFVTCPEGKRLLSLLLCCPIAGSLLERYLLLYQKGGGEGRGWTENLNIELKIFLYSVQCHSANVPM